MIIINFKTKWGDRIVQSDDRAKIFTHVLAERIEDGFWYDGHHQDDAEVALVAGKAESFMRARRDYEYEGYEELRIETV